MNKIQLSMIHGIIMALTISLCVVSKGIAAPSSCVKHNKIKSSPVKPKPDIKRKVQANISTQPLPHMPLPNMSKYPKPLSPLGPDRPTVPSTPLPEVGFGVPNNFWIIHPGPSVVVSCDVGNDGKPINLALKSYSGNDSVDKLALEAVRHLHLPPGPNDPSVRHLTFLCKGFRQ